MNSVEGRGERERSEGMRGRGRGVREGGEQRNRVKVEKGWNVEGSVEGVKKEKMWKKESGIETEGKEKTFLITTGRNKSMH